MSVKQPTRSRRRLFSCVLGLFEIHYDPIRSLTHSSILLGIELCRRDFFSKSQVMIDESFMGPILQHPNPFFLCLGLGGKVKQLQHLFREIRESLPQVQQLASLLHLHRKMAMTMERCVTGIYLLVLKPSELLSCSKKFKRIRTEHG
ncbi:uncharacterized protein LOC115727713 [Rhodamnia argentea]|uniref:Uncharacterized protein LOC115727713 n=1 Tax=Rhodamnia argentea TaxID=178133 RepID=A0A8B8MUT0_9MYRT|nr:uncharacterized protein LOC115727713 [Rhodamnia argentea]